MKRIPVEALFCYVFSALAFSWPLLVLLSRKFAANAWLSNPAGVIAVWLPSAVCYGTAMLLIGNFMWQTKFLTRGSVSTLRRSGTLLVAASLCLAVGKAVQVGVSGVSAKGMPLPTAIVGGAVLTLALGLVLRQLATLLLQNVEMRSELEQIV